MNLKFSTCGNNKKVYSFGLIQPLLVVSWRCPRRQVFSIFIVRTPLYYLRPVRKCLTVRTGPARPVVGTITYNGA